jgi:hypothetical protein
MDVASRSGEDVRMGSSTAPAIVRLVGVYDAEGTWRGEVRYWVGARLGRTHCSLCEITHSSIREKSAWRECRAGLPVPFDAYHRDDQPADIKAALAGVVPAVVAETTDGVVVLLGPDELTACQGSVDALEAAIERRVEERGLAWSS